MHPCLCVTELVWHIFDDVDALCGDDTTRNKTFYALARTCRSFRDPALAHLWRSIRSLIPLVMCIGRDMCEVVAAEDNGSKVRFARRLSPSALMTIKRYAHFVQHFGPDFGPYQLARSTTVSVHIEVWKKLKSRLKGSMLFPNIRTVSIQDEQTMKFITLFATDNLVSYSLSLPMLPSEQAHSQFAMLTEFSIRCPELKSVNLSGFFLQPQAPVAAVVNWYCLTRFYSHQVTPLILEVVSRNCSSSLRYLGFDTLVPDDPVSSSEEVYFPAVERLATGFLEFSDALSLLEHFPASDTLRYLTIRIHFLEPSSEEEWLELLHLIKKRLQCLTELSIEEEEEEEEPEEYDDTAEPLSNALIRLLTTDFTMLTRIRISRVGGFNVVDQDFKALTEALPLLEEFCLVDCASPRPVDFKNTMASLAYFAGNCPSLTSLALAFDTRISEIPPRQGSSTVPSKLKWLDASFSPVYNPPVVARVLFDIFPTIRGIICKGNDEAIESDHHYDITVAAWLEVESIVQVLQVQERGRPKDL